MDCLSSSFKNCSWSWLVCSIRASFEVRDPSPFSAETFSFRRTRTSTGLASSSVSLATSLGASVATTSELTFGLAITEDDKVFSSLGFSFEESLATEEVFSACLVRSLPSVSVGVGKAEVDSSTGTPEISSLTATIGSIAFSSVVVLSGTTTVESTVVGAGVTVSAETTDPIKTIPIKTEATPTAYLRMEKRCCR